MLKSLTFVPPGEVLNYYSKLSNHLKRNKDAKKMCNWFAKNYIGNCSKNPLEKTVKPNYPATFWSVASNEELYFPRTQNNVEAWHRRLQVKN